MKVTNTVWHWRWKNHLQTLNEVKAEAKYFPYIEELRAFDKLPRELTADQYWEEPKPKTKYTAIKTFLVDLVEKGKAERLGAGAFRTVYGFKDNPDVILKVARGAHGRSSFKMNKDDYELFRKYPSISPRVYAHDDEDWAWVYMEAVEPATMAGWSNAEKYYDAVLDTFPKITKYILQSDLKSRINTVDPDHLMLAIGTAAAKLARGDRPLPSMDSLMHAIKWWTEDHEDEIIANADPAFFELSKAMVEFDIAPEEIREKNVGYGKDGKLILIDSSIFPQGV
jgi:hypothetical protein